MRKTELIRTQLGSAGQVIGYKLSDRLEREGILRAKSLAREIDEAGDKELLKTATDEMDDKTEARRARQAKEIDDLRETLERSREKVGVDPEELRTVFATALSRAGTSLDAAGDGEINGTPIFRFDPADPVFAAGGWPEALDDLRICRRKRTERLKDWRAKAPLRAVSFRPATTKEGADAEGVLQLHLEHRLVRRGSGRGPSRGRRHLTPAMVSSCEAA
jgi:hypothetical protein